MEEKKSLFRFSLGAGVGCLVFVLAMIAVVFALTHLSEIWSALEAILASVPGE